MNKIIFIEPRPPSLHVFSKYMTPRLGLFILGRLMQQRGWEVVIYVEDLGTIEWEQFKTADIVGISSITSTAPRAYKIADKARSMGVPVIMGGPHPTFLTEEALQHADFVVRGEGEIPMMAFSDAWEKKRDFSKVPGLSYKKDGVAVHNPVSKTMPPMDRIPFPDFSLARGNNLLAKGKTIPIQTSRGCPFNCMFCSVTPMFGKKYRYRSIENIIQELRQYEEGKHFVFFYDDNFTANPTHTKELLKAMIKEKLTIKWSAQVRTDVAKDLDLVKLMRKAGCRVVFIGYESVNPDSLNEMKKNQDVADIVRATKILRKNRIRIHGMFMMGLDHDNKKSVKRSLRFAMRNMLTSVQFLILTPFPGSELYNIMKSKKRIIFNDWSLYDAHHVVFKPANFTEAELQVTQLYCHKKFYSKLTKLRKLSIGDIKGLLIAFYANHLNRIWLKENRAFLNVLELLKPNRNAEITIDYREKITLSGES